MAARREKVSRWESGRIVPDLTTQFAMAHLHNVPRNEVLLRGWPQWLHITIRDSSLCSLPWTSEGTAAALRAVARQPWTVPGIFPATAADTGVALVDDWLAAVEATPPPGQTSHHSNAEVAVVLEIRVDALELMETRIQPRALLPVARTELDLISSLLPHADNDRGATARLQVLAARVAYLCSVLAFACADFAQRESFLLVCMRAATAAGAPGMAAIALASLASLHLDIGATRDAQILVAASRRIAARTGPVPRLDALLHCRQAWIHAQLGDAEDSSRSFSAALNTHNAESTVKSPWTIYKISDELLQLTAGISQLALGQPARAMNHFALLTHDDPSDHYSPSIVAIHLPDVIDAQLAIGDVEAAVDTVRKAQESLQNTGAELPHHFRQRFAAYRAVPAVRDLLDRVRDQESRVCRNGKDLT